MRDITASLRWPRRPKRDTKRPSVTLRLMDILLRLALDCRRRCSFLCPSVMSKLLRRSRPRLPPPSPPRPAPPDPSRRRTLTVGKKVQSHQNKVSSRIPPWAGGESGTKTRGVRSENTSTTRNTTGRQQIWMAALYSKVTPSLFPSLPAFQIKNVSS